MACCWSPAILNSGSKSGRLGNHPTHRPTQLPDQNTNPLALHF